MTVRGKARAARVATGVVAVLVVIMIAAVVVGMVYLWRLGQDLFSSSQGDVVIVPEVTGLPVAEAETAIRDRGLIPDIVRRHYDETREAGLVTKQNPSGESRRKQGGKVSLWESLGPASFTVPKLTGQQIGDVPRIIAESGLRLGSIKKVFAENTPKGRVINQSPEPGREFHTPVPIDIVVADNSASTRSRCRGTIASGS